MPLHAEKSPAPGDPTRSARRIIITCIALSLAVHAGAMLGLHAMAVRAARLTDTPGESSELVLGLDLPEPQPPIPQPRPTPPPPVTPPPEPARNDPPPPPRTDPPPAESARPAAPEISFEPSKTVTPPESLLKPIHATPAPAPAAAPTSDAGSGTSIQPAAPPPPPSHSATFAGVKAERAQRVVYAVDTSAAMTTTLPDAFAALRQSIARLQPDQEFQVILFRDPIAVEGDPPSTSDLSVWIGQDPKNPADAPRLLSASAENKALLRPLLDSTIASGPSNPITGLRRALALKPQVVFLFSCGFRRSGTTWGVGAEETLAELDQLNPAPEGAKRPVVIKTIEFRISDREDQADATGLMRQIAETHGDGLGAYTAMTREALRRATHTDDDKRR